MTTKDEQRLVTFSRYESGEVVVIVHGDVPAALVERIHANRRAIIEWLEGTAGCFRR
jgi:hypothetical protein